MQHIIEGFLNFQKEIFPSVKNSSAAASSQNPKSAFHLLF